LEFISFVFPPTQSFLTKLSWFGGNPSDIAVCSEGSWHPLVGGVFCDKVLIFYERRVIASVIALFIQV
jgi:hypothetical protein